MGRKGKNHSRAAKWAKADDLNAVFQQPMRAQQQDYEAETGAQRQNRLPTCGLLNNSNDCYINAGLQLLTCDRTLARSIEKALPGETLPSAPATQSLYKNVPPGPHLNVNTQGEIELNLPRMIVCNFLKAKRRCMKAGTHATAESNVADYLHQSGQFIYGEQSDCEEFLTYYLNSICNEMRFSGRQDIVYQAFGGATEVQIKDSNEGPRSVREPLLTLSLAIDGSSVSEMLERMCQPQQLDNGGTSQTSLVCLPEYLLLCLKVYTCAGGELLKIYKPVDVEEHLVIPNVAVSSSSTTCPPARYDLLSVVCHSGYTPESGHYTAGVRDSQGNWVHCDDHEVSHSSLQHILSARGFTMPYCLLYKRS